MIEMKAPTAELDWPITYTLADGETISSSTWAVSPTGELAIKVGSDTISGLTTSAIVTGGTLGKVYEVTNTILTNQSRTDVRTITFRIGAVEATQ